VTDGAGKLILGAALGECVHVAGVLSFLRIAEQEGYRTLFTGPATPVNELVAAIQRESPDIVAVSYRLTPENARSLLLDMGESCSNEGGGGGRPVSLRWRSGAALRSKPMWQLPADALLFGHR